MVLVEKHINTTESGKIVCGRRLINLDFFMKDI